MAHKLNLHIEDSVYNNDYLLISDLSIWDEMLDITDRILQIKPPYEDRYVKVHFPMNQVTSVSAIHLLLSDKLVSLPDGLYKIHYSVAPNKKVNVEYCHFRVGYLASQVLSKMAGIEFDCSHTIDQCGNVELTKMQTTLLHIWMLLMGAQAVGRESSREEAAKTLYRQACLEFDKLMKNDNCEKC